ncbi:MAG: anion permease [Acidobacteria bacterium]|nr:anion permease [Acidobacteriota bacterium]
MSLFAPRVLPDRSPARDDLSEGFREFVVKMAVVGGGPLDGRSVGEGRLRNLKGVFLVEIEREGEVIAPVTPHTMLSGGDLLTFVGRVDEVVDLQTTRGLRSNEQKHLEKFDTARQTFFEVVLGPGSPLVGRTLKTADFRDRYQAAVVAIHRAGRRVGAKLGGVMLRPGDTLLVLSDPGFGNRWRDRSAFLLVARLGGVTPAATKKAWVVGAVVLGVVLSAALGFLPVLHAALVGAFALVITGVLTPAEARTAVDLDVILVIAGAFGLAAALQVSGLAEHAAGLLVTTFDGWGPAGVMIGIVLTTVTLISIISNNAAAVLMFPIAISTASGLGLSTRAFAIAVAIAASASFLTPIAYQTNIMVYGPGGYRFGDFARLGAPLTLVVVAGWCRSSGLWAKKEGFCHGPSF